MAEISGLGFIYSVRFSETLVAVESGARRVHLAIAAHALARVGVLAVAAGAASLAITTAIVGEGRAHKFQAAATVGTKPAVHPATAWRGGALVEDTIHAGEAAKADDAATPVATRAVPESEVCPGHAAEV